MEYQELKPDVYDNMMRGVDDRISSYVAQNYLPIYDGKDRGKFGLFNAHGIEHIDWATRRSMEMAKEYNKGQGILGWIQGKHLDLNMMYVIARLHDIGFFVDSGIKEVDETRHHEKIGAQIVANDPGLRQFFTEEQIAEIVKAIYDHKQREKGDPESMYGKILYTADRRFRALEAIRNSYMFTKSKNKDWTFDQIVDDVQSYLLKEYGGTVEQASKYGLEKGYVEDKEYDNDLNALLEILRDRDTLAQTMRGMGSEVEEHSNRWDTIRKMEKENPDMQFIK